MAKVDDLADVDDLEGEWGAGVLWTRIFSLDHPLTRLEERLDCVRRGLTDKRSE
jgi:hypothetical protein